MIRPVDLLILAIFVGTQVRVSLLLWGAAKARLQGKGLNAAAIGIGLFGLVVAAGYALSYSQVLSHWRIRPAGGMYFGAAAITYLITATGLLVLHALWTWVAGMAAGTDPGRRRVLERAGNVVMAAPLAVLGYGTFVERFAFHVREVDVPAPDLPRGLDGLRIAQVSDIHLGAFLSRKQFAGVIDQANELSPHLAIVTGDLISTYGDPLDDCIAEIARLRADAGVYGCLGNHERYAQAEDYAARCAARLGVSFLRSRARPLQFGGSILNLGGVDYQRSFGEGRDYLRGAERLLLPGAFNVLLSHNPDVFPVAARKGFDLMLSGHTHGGQVSVEILDQAVNPARFFTPYVYGLYRSGKSSAYVTRGIGTIGIPARIGAPPEITLLRLRKV